MHCPRCETTLLDERDREGVTVDVCKTCRGLWLDRGELEKLITRAGAELDEYERRPPQYRGDDDYRRRHPRKKSWVETLGDIFD